MEIKDLIGEDEEIVSIDNKSLDIIENFFHHYEEYYKVASIEKVLFGDDVHFIVQLFGGKNGNGNWYDYLFHLSKLFASEYYSKRGIENIWLIQLENDCMDDIHDVFVGLTLKD